MSYTGDIMPRRARVKSETGIYHVMLRGINGQQIFHDDEDNRYFLEVLGICKEISDFELFAYCLMGNHVHILLKAKSEDIDLIFKRIGTRYVYWYNQKYKRIGHLFQDRYKSEPIETDRYYLAVLRYIHKNPVKAGICETVDAYKWSSYEEYIEKSRIVDVAFALSLMTMDEFIIFNSKSDDAEFLEDNARLFRHSDTEAKAMIQELCNIRTLDEFQKFESSERNRYLSRLKEKNLSIRQLCRLTGVSRSIVARA